MKLKIKNIVVGFICTVLCAFIGKAADSNPEMLKPWQQGGFQMMTLDSWMLTQRDSAIAILTAEEGTERRNVLVVNVLTESKGCESWHLTLAHGGLKFKKGKAYQLSFSIKGANVSGLTVGIIQNHEPWMPIAGGDPQSVTAGAAWQDCRYTFNIQEDDPNGSLVFSNFNVKGATFSLANVSLKETQSTTK